MLRYSSPSDRGQESRKSMPYFHSAGTTVSSSSSLESCLLGFVELKRVVQAREALQGNEVPPARWWFKYNLERNERHNTECKAYSNETAEPVVPK